MRTTIVKRQEMNAITTTTMRKKENEKLPFVALNVDRWLMCVVDAFGKDKKLRSFAMMTIVCWPKIKRNEKYSRMLRFVLEVLGCFPLTKRASSLFSLACINSI